MKLKIFISSRDKERVVINGVSGDILTEIRKQLKKELEGTKSFTGRPFEKDHELISISKKRISAKYGPIHFIGVYGNATELQAKKLIGFPDISAIRDDFGIYVWEQTTHVQLIFLTECKTPEAIKSKFILFNNWCRSNGEYESIVKRAKARFHILKSINEAKAIAISK